jgi:hypothetical protein
MEKYKSIHVVTYICSYNGKIKFIEDCHLDNGYDDNDGVYFEGFQKLFSNPKMIKKYSFEKLPVKNEKKINVSDSTCELKVTKDYSIYFDIDSVNVYNASKLNLLAVELILVNKNSEDYINISRNIDKNIKFSTNDEFQGIFLNGIEIISPVFNQEHNAKRLSQFFFKDKVKNLNILLGRKNYQVMSIISDELAKETKMINENSNLDIFRIATSDDAPNQLGPKFFNNFLNSVYDKWIHTGSVYIINNVNTTQVLKSDKKQYANQMIYTYNKMIIISLFQKAKFIEFQNIEQKNSQMKHFNYVINKYYFMEVSQEHQVQFIYEMLQEQLKNDKYYEILKDEIEIYRSTTNMRLMLMVTVFYTLMSLITVILMLVLK